MENEETKQQEKPTLISEATEAARRLEEANEKKEELLRIEEDLLARKLLAGKAEAGEVKEEKIETPKEYANRVLKGSLNG